MSGDGLNPDDPLHWQGGDPARGTSVPPSGLDLQTEYKGYPGFVRLPKVPLAPIDPSLLVLDATPNDYESISVSWSLGAANLDNFNLATLVRSGFGYPNTPNDGEQIFMLRRGAASADITIDGPLQSGRWYYYTLFVKLGTRWKILKQDCALVPIDYGHSEILWDRLPPYYRWADDQVFAGTQSSVLRRLFSMIGFDLDLTRTMAEGLEQSYSIDSGPAQLVNEIGHQNLGVDRYTNLGDIRVRAFTGMATRLFETRGTLSGVRGVVAAMSQALVDVRSGRNMLLVPDDSEFVTSTGHWTALPGVLNKYIVDNAASITNGTASGSGSAAVLAPSGAAALWGTPILSVATDIDPPVVPVDSFGNARSIGVHAMKVAPEVRVTDLNVGGQWKYQERVSPLFICCGAGRLDRKNADGDVQTIEMDPQMYGIPVESGKTYHLSFFARKANQRVTYGYDPSYPRAPVNKTPNTSADGSPFWWDQDAYPAITDPTSTPYMDNWVRPVTASGMRQTDVVYGMAWYQRDTIKTLGDNKAFNDGFGQGIAPSSMVPHPPNATVNANYSPSGGSQFIGSFSGFRRLVPTEIDFYSLQASIDTTDEWQFFTHSFGAPGGCDIGVPIIGLMPPASSYNQTNHYLAGISFTKEQDSGVETQANPDHFILLGPSNVSSALSGTSVLGPSPIQ